MQLFGLPQLEFLAMQDVTNAALAVVRRNFAASHPDALIIGIPAAELQRRWGFASLPLANTQALYNKCLTGPPSVLRVLLGMECYCSTT